MITIQNADAALKDYYLEAISAQLNDNISPLFSQIEKNTDNVFGKEVKLAVVRGNSGGVIAGAEDGDLPDPHANRYANICVPLKNLYGTIEISDKALRASRDSSGAFVNLLNAEMEGLVLSAKENFRRMLFGDGKGVIGLSNDKQSDKVFKLWSKPKKYFVGMQVDVYYTEAMIKLDKKTYIEDIDEAKGTITLSDPITEDPALFVFVVHDSFDNELTGLDAIFNDGDLYGYNKSTDKFFKPYVCDAKGNIDENMICDVIDYMEENFNSKINAIVCSYKTRKRIAAFIQDNRRVVNSIDVNTGYGAVTVSGIPVYADKYCPDDRIMFLNTDDFALYQLCDWEWLEDEDGKILKQIPGKAAYSATLVKYAELICRKPCGQAMLKNIGGENG